MSWVAVGLAAVSAVSSAKQNEAKAAQQKRSNLAEAEMTRYSPWTGIAGKPDHSYMPGSTEGAISGGIQGLGMAQSLKNSGAFDSKPAPTVAPTSQPSAIGAPDYSQALGQQGANFQAGMGQKPSMWDQVGQQPNMFAKNSYFGK